MKNKLTSLELSKELDSLGVRVGSYFVWVLSAPFFNGDHSEKDLIMNPNQYAELIENVGEGMHEIIPAYSVAELGKIELRHYDLPYWHESNGWQIPMLEKEGVYHRCDNEACARAKMLIHLIKNNLLDVTKLN